MKRISLTLAILILINLTTSLSWAKIGVSLKLDRSETLLADSVQLTVSVSGSRDSESTPDIQGLENFDVGSGGASSRLEIINGKMTSGVDYTYFVQPHQPGTFQIGPARVQINGKTYTSNTAKLRVVKPTEGKSANRGPLLLTAFK